MMQMAVVSTGGPTWRYVLAWIYFWAYFFLGILMVLNIILGMVLNFIGTYLHQTEELELEKEKTKVPLWKKVFRIPQKKFELESGPDEKQNLV
jgi:predicted membrane protein